MKLLKPKLTTKSYWNLLANKMATQSSIYTKKRTRVPLGFLSPTACVLLGKIPPLDCFYTISALDCTSWVCFACAEGQGLYCSGGKLVYGGWW